MKLMVIMSLALGAVAALLTGCAGSGADLEPFRAFPNSTGFKAEEVWEAYGFAAANPQVLQYIPCYCGCNNLGHRSNEDCYIGERKPDGSIVYNPHAAG